MPRTIEVEQEQDRRWLAEAPQRPGVLTYESPDEGSFGGGPRLYRVLEEGIDRMISRRMFVFLVGALMAASTTPAVTRAAVAGKSATDDLAVAAAGKSSAVVAVSPKAGEWEKRAATDLVRCIERMTGAKPALADTDAAVAAALQGAAPVLVVGQAALVADPSLSAALAKVAKPNPILRADAIVVRRAGNRVYLAGTNDDSHYYAVSHLLHAWGCRWYLPTEFGECIPTHPELKVGQIDLAWAPPFEVRRYWISWVGDTTGKPEFMRRNFLNDESVPSGHVLATYTKDLVPPGKTHWNVPITEDRTALHVAKQVSATYGAGRHVMLGMEDGLYESDSPLDKELVALQYDKYFMTQSVTDAFLVFYNKVADQLMKEHPASKAKIGFLAYANMTIPPVREITAKKPLVAYLAPIDIDPIHGMDDPRSAPVHEYREMLYRWAKVMEGRLVIYDYDQGMLVWRDVPAPSVQMFRNNVQHYRKAGILGVDTESRGAMATTFLNLFHRAQLLWNPDADVDALTEEFYANFYGPAAAPMKAYWSAIDKAWRDTLVTEHEYFVIPAIYTPELVETLRKHLAAAEQIGNSIQVQGRALSTNERLALDRLKFTRLGFAILDAYTRMIRAANTEIDYAAAVAAGQQGLAAREELTARNGTFTTYKQIGESGAAWWPGEVEQYKGLKALADGTKGTLVAKLPVEWAFRRDAKNAGEKEGWASTEVDLTWWNGLDDPRKVEHRQKNPGHWELVRSDLYLQAQGLVTPDWQSWTGIGWYRADLDLAPEQAAGSLRLMFPGLFNVTTLYVNGEKVATREKYNKVWWYNDYKFEWDVDVAGKLKPGKNTVAVRIDNPHHFGGMFRRPFVYRAK